MVKAKLKWESQHQIIIAFWGGVLMVSLHKIVACESRVGPTIQWAGCTVLRSNAGVNSGVFFFIDPSTRETIVVKPMHPLDIERTLVADSLFEAANLQIAPITMVLDIESDSIVRNKLKILADTMVPKEISKTDEGQLIDMRGKRNKLKGLLKQHPLQFFTMDKLNAKPISECSSSQIGRLVNSDQFWESLAAGFMVDVVTGNHDRFISFNPGNIMIGTNDEVYFIDNNLDISTPEAHVANLPRIIAKIPEDIRTFCGNLHESTFCRSSIEINSETLASRFIAKINMASTLVRQATTKIQTKHPLFAQIAQSDILGPGESI